MKGTQGHLQGSEGFGPNGMVPSLMRMPGQPAYRLSGDSWRSSALTGKRRMWYFRMTPLRPVGGTVDLADHAGAEVADAEAAAFVP